MTRTAAAVLVSVVLLGGLAASAGLAKLFDFAVAGVLIAGATYYPLILLIYRRLWRTFPPAEADAAHVARLPYILGAGTLVLMATSIGIMRGTDFVTRGAWPWLELALAVAGLTLLLVALRTDWLLGSKR